MNFELLGKLIHKEDVNQVTDSFKKREFVIEVENERNHDWNDFIKFQLTQDRCDLIEGLSIGEKIKVIFNIRGRKWEKNGQVNYFSNLEAWKVEKIIFQSMGNVPVESQTTSKVEGVSQNTGDISSSSPEEEDDLPF